MDISNELVPGVYRAWDELSQRSRYRLASPGAYLAAGPEAFDKVRISAPSHEIVFSADAGSVTWRGLTVKRDIELADNEVWLRMEAQVC